MPELPEVETTCRGLEPHVLHKTILAVCIRQPKLRYPVSLELSQLVGQCFERIERRGKYLLLKTLNGDTVLVHLGMSGSLCIEPPGLAKTIAKHQHIDICFADGGLLCYRDPRRFGAWLWLGQTDAYQHALLQHLGPEPLSEAFNSAYVLQHTRGKSVVIKKWLMNSQRVVGVGNIYANEALFRAAIQPLRLAMSLSASEAERLVHAVQQVLQQAISVGGTTLKDFASGDHQPGYFSQALRVYGRGGQACQQCGWLLQETRLDQRSTVYCLHCQC